MIGMAVVASLPAGGADGAGELAVADLARPLSSWRAKPNVELSFEEHQGQRALRADIDFADVRYGWFRTVCHEQPWDLRAFGGLRIRLAGGGGCEVLVHLMTDVAQSPPRTFALRHPVPLAGGESWQAVFVSWEDLGLQGDDSPLEAADLAHVQEVNISVTGSRGRRPAVWLGEVTGLASVHDGARAGGQSATSYRTPIADDAAFFSLLDVSAVPELRPVVDALPDVSAASSRLLKHMQRRARPVYFFDPHRVAELAELMGKGVRGYRGSVVRRTEGLLTHRYTWEGETRQLQRPIDYRQNDGEWSAVLNRSGYLDAVAKGWWLTGEERFAEEVVGQLCEWRRSCPIPAEGRAGRTWHPLEVGCRAHSWARLYMSVLTSPAFTPAANLEIMKAIVEHARYLSDPHLRRGLPNMVVVEATGLATLGMLFPEFGEARGWLETGLRVLDRALSRRVLADGAWEEVTPGYHSWVAHSCLGLSILADRNAVALPDGLGPRFRSMYEWLLKVLKPDGHMPMLGDASDSSAAHFMTEAALAFRDPGFRFAGRSAPPRSLLEWFGAETDARYSRIEVCEPGIGSLFMPECGLAVMRTGWDRQDSWMLVDVGPIWSHTHEDTLGFSLYAAGRTRLWDSGVCQYNMPECRRYYRQARGHNVVVPDDMDIRLSGRAIVHGWTSHDDVDMIDAEARFRDPSFRHRRQILFLKPHAWIIRDVLRADAPHTYRRLFHLDREARAETVDGVCRVSHGDGVVLEIRNVHPVASTIETAPGLLTFHHGRGPGNNNLEAPVLRLINQAPAGTTDLLTVLTVEPSGNTRCGFRGFRASTGALTIDTASGARTVRVPPLVDGAPPPMEVDGRSGP